MLIPKPKPKFKRGDEVSSKTFSAYDFIIKRLSDMRGDEFIYECILEDYDTPGVAVLVPESDLSLNFNLGDGLKVIRAIVERVLEDPPDSTLLLADFQRLARNFQQLDNRLSQRTNNYPPAWEPDWSDT